MVSPSGRPSRRRQRGCSERLRHFEQSWRPKPGGWRPEARRLPASEELTRPGGQRLRLHREVEGPGPERARLREAVESSARELEAASREREALAEALAAAGPRA